MNRRLIVVLLMLLQMTTGAQVSVIRGTVVDEANAVIPGAEVRLEHLETGEKKTAFSSEVGAFSFLNVRQGKVRITVRLPGFQNWSQEVQLGHEELRLTVPLHVASASTQVEVSVASASVGIVTRSGTGGQVAARRRVANGGYREMNTESYDYIQDNPFARVTEHPRSTFAIDVDTASYANMRRFVNIKPSTIVSDHQLNVSIVRR